MDKKFFSPFKNCQDFLLSIEDNKKNINFEKKEIKIDDISILPTPKKVPDSYGGGSIYAETSFKSNIHPSFL